MGTYHPHTDLVELPPGFSKRGLYYHWCRQRGWNVRSDARGRLVKMEDPIPGQEPQPIIDWRTFRIFWDKHYPTLVVKTSSRAVCEGGQKCA
mmetsp:Transcript_22024/g.31586  ORF Transcript_22024/g.31586 Transcript_22024/m.31586 type:complete len:92 (-) Transcript_22024:70-345(-)